MIKSLKLNDFELEIGNWVINDGVRKRVDKIIEIDNKRMSYAVSLKGKDNIINDVIVALFEPNPLSDWELNNS